MSHDGPGTFEQFDTDSPPPSPPPAQQKEMGRSYSTCWCLAWAVVLVVTGMFLATHVEEEEVGPDEHGPHASDHERAVRGNSTTHPPPTQPAVCTFQQCCSLFYDGVVPDQPHGNNFVQLCKEGVMAISYDTTMLSPAFSVVFVTPQQAKNVGTYKRKEAGTFKKDDSLGVTQAPVTSLVFKKIGGGYDKGHLTPSNIMSYDYRAMKLTFLMSNIAPQNSKLNQGSWKILEKLVTDYIAAAGDDVPGFYIITGVGYVDPNRVRRPYDNIAIPDYFFKVICDPYRHKSAGFYAQNNIGNDKSALILKSVKYIEDNIYRGRLFSSACNTATVDSNLWWGQ